MTTAPSEPQGLRLTAREIAFLGLSVLLWTGYVVLLGKDTSWDFRNYHWYIPYALLNGRMSIDMLVAHQASYYNPYLDVPFYLLAQHTNSFIAVAVLGFFQAANMVPIYVIARTALRMPQRRLWAAGIAFFSLTGGMTLSLFGTHYYDNVMSFFILSSLCILIVGREQLAGGSFKSAFWWSALGAFMVGASAGLKLPTAPFAVGYVAAVLAVGGDRKHILIRLAGTAAGGLAGFMLCAGPWMLKMYEITGNPLFPYFNQYFHSPLALASPYRDMRFLPTSTLKTLLYPILFAIDYRVADDLPHNDIRIAIAYVLIIVTSLIWLLGRRSKHPLAVPASVRITFVFVAVAYVCWIKLFAIHRYILTMEMMAPLLIALAVSLLPAPPRYRQIAIGILFFFALLFTRSAVMERAPLGEPYIEADLPQITQPDRTMVLMTGDAPLGFIAPSLPPQVPVVRIDGWMVQPDDGTTLTRQMKARVGAHKGPLVLISDAYDMDRAKDALDQYGLDIDWHQCHLFETNLVGAYQWCPLYRQEK